MALPTETESAAILRNTAAMRHWMGLVGLAINTGSGLVLPVIGAATGPLGTALRVPVVTIDVYGRVTALTDIAIALGATGDATGTLPGALTLATVNANVGTFGDATHSLTATVDGKGRITALSSNVITGVSASYPLTLNDGTYTYTISASGGVLTITSFLNATPTTKVTFLFDIAGGGDLDVVSKQDMNFSPSRDFNVAATRNANLIGTTLTTVGDALHPVKVRGVLIDPTGGTAGDVLTLGGGGAIALATPAATPALTNTHILVGNASNVAADVAMSGDTTIANTGAVTIKTNVALAGSPTTTTQAAADNSTKIATTAYADAAAAARQSTILTAAHLLVGNVSNVATDTAITGDVTISNAGVTAIGATKVTNAMLAGSIDLTSKVTGALPIPNGGTGQTTATPAYDALCPTTTRGDVTTFGASASQRLALGANGLFLGSDGTDAIYRQPPYVAGYDAGGSVINATTTLTSLLASTFTIPILVLGTYWKLEGSFGWTNNTGAGQTLNIQILIGGSSVINVTTASIVANASNHRIDYEITGRCRVVGGAGVGSVSFNGRIFISAVTGVIFDNLQATTADFGGGGPVTAVTNATQSLDIQAAMSTNTAGGQVVPQPSSFTVSPKLI